MLRKLTPQGVGGLTIYLPPKWLRKNNLTRNDYVHVEEDGNLLLISSNKKQKKVVELDVENPSTFELKNLLTHAYRSGIDELILKGTLPPSIETNFLIGASVLDLTETQANIIFLTPEDSDFHSVLKKIFFQISYSFDLLNSEDFEELIKLKSMVDRNILFCRRLLSKNVISKNIFAYWELLSNLIQINHSQYYFSLFLKKNETLSSDSKRFIGLIKNNFKLYHDAYYKQSLSPLKKLNLEDNKFHLGALFEIDASSGQIAYLKEMSRLIQLGSSPLLMLIIENKFKPS